MSKMEIKRNDLAIVNGYDHGQTKPIGNLNENTHQAMEKSLVCHTHTHTLTQSMELNNNIPSTDLFILNFSKIVLKFHFRF